MIRRCPAPLVSRLLVSLLCLGLSGASWADEDTDPSPPPTLALRLPELPLPDLRDLARLPLPVPDPEYLHVSFNWYLPFQTLGFKGGTMYAPFDNYSTRSALGMVTSGRFNVDPLLMFSMEMEIMGTNSLVPGSNTGEDVWSANTFGLYLALRFGDPVFFKLRGGWMVSNIYVAGGSQPGVTRTDTALPVGVGLGWRVGPRMIMETEFTWAGRDLGIMTVGILF